MRRLLAFFGVCLLVALAPGPDNCFVLAQSAAFGAWAGLWVTAGLMCGLCVHITLAALGVAAALERWPRAADVISIVGACYLFYMAWGMWGAWLGAAWQEPAEDASGLDADVDTLAEAGVISNAGYWKAGRYAADTVAALIGRMAEFVRGVA